MAEVFVFNYKNMSAKVLSAAVVGLDAKIVEVEADTSRGLPKTFIVGLPDTAVQEAKERVRSGIRNSGFDWPPGVVTVNLAPANLKKEGPHYDLPIAVAVLLARKFVCPATDILDKVFVGELSLNGDLRPVNGILSVATLVREKGIHELYVPVGNAAEAALIPGLSIFPVRTLAELSDHLNGDNQISVFISQPSSTTVIAEYSQDMAFVKGQEQAKRALEIAAAGGHNVLMTGPPGSGKTLLARSLPSILPSLSLEESLEVTKIYSVAGLLPKETPILTNRPFRAPHHTTSAVALVGGGSFPRPGEISLAHRGVLFLDELPEFSRYVLETLRQPLEDGLVTVARAAGSVQFPAQFIFIAARNPCPCGYLDDPRQPCTCHAHQIIKYQKKISGPLLDRIDLHVTVPRLEYRKMTSVKPGESSQIIRQRVVAARTIQAERFVKLPVRVNAEMTVRHLDGFCRLEAGAEELLKRAVNQLALSARTYHRLLKVARTIADLSGSETVSAHHVAEALQYRPA